MAKRGASAGLPVQTIFAWFRGSPSASMSSYREQKIFDPGVRTTYLIMSFRPQRILRFFFFFLNPWVHLYTL